MGCRDLSSGSLPYLQPGGLPGGKGRNDVGGRREEVPRDQVYCPRECPPSRCGFLALGSQDFLAAPTGC